MRKLKFRVWDTSKKKFFYSDWKYGEFSFWEEVLHDYEDRFTSPMQFTGLTAKEGKEIYEGDIVKQIDAKFPDNIFQGSVLYDIPNAAFLITAKDGKQTGLGAAEVYLEIVGNVFEN